MLPINKLVILLMLAVFTTAAATTPELPRITVDTTYSEPTGKVIKVAPGESLQRAIDSSAPGDVIELEAGAIHTGVFNIHKRAGYVHVRTAGCPIKPGNRATPADAPYMAKIQTPNAESVIQVNPGASYWRFSCVEIMNSRADMDTTAIVYLQPSTMSSPDDYPHHIIFDRVLIHGNPGNRVRRAFRFGGAHMALIDSSCYDIRQPGYDTQCVSDSQGPGPYKIHNNYLEASTENVAFGGSNPPFPGVMPCDIEITGNHMF
jgi:hypothetical protein